MPSINAELKELRSKVEALQVEVAGRQNISSMVIWDEQNLSSVNQKSPTKAEQFNGLVIHLTDELSPLIGTIDDTELSHNEFEALKERLRRDLTNGMEF